MANYGLYTEAKMYGITEGNLIDALCSLTNSFVPHGLFHLDYWHQLAIIIIDC